MHFVYQNMQKYAFKVLYDKHKNIVPKKNIYLLKYISGWLFVLIYYN
jgi:hypothetical protein